MTRRRWRLVTRTAGGLVLTGVLVGCSGGGGDDDGASLGVTEPPTPVTAPAPPAAAPEGTGVVVVGGSTSSFAVTGCRLEADPADPAGAQTLVLVTGAGTTAGEVPFEVEIKRFATGTGVQTFTDTISYADTARILQAQRVEVNGQVQDLRDPTAVSTLIRTRDDGVAASGIAGPPGSEAGADGTVGLAVDATCPTP